MRTVNHIADQAMYMRTIIPMLLLVLPASAIAQSGGGGADIHVSGQFISDEPTGNPPLQVQSSTNVPNLNADKLDGFDVGDFASEGSGVGVHYKNLVGVPGREIDQDCATGAGCFAGDPGGFPVEITEPGSYRLASNLTTTDANTTIIDIQEEDVVLDLQGFRIGGPADCSGTPASCTTTGLGIGVRSTFPRTSVRHGNVSGMGGNGIQVLAGAQVENVTAVGNGGNGIQVDVDSRVAGSVARGNGGHGIEALSGSVVTDNTANRNGVDGFNLLSTRVVGNTAIRNGEDGVDCGGHCVARENLVNDNANDGIRVPDASVVVGNTVTNNDDDGIVNTFAPGTVLDNAVNGNVGIGLNLQDRSGYARNVLSDNGTSVSGGLEVGTNVCGTDTTCP